MTSKKNLQKGLTMMSKNRDSERIAEVIRELTNRGIPYQLLPPADASQLALLALVRPTRSQTSFNQIEKTVQKKVAPIQDSGADQSEDPRRQRYQSRDERRFRVAQSVRQYCIERRLRIWDDDDNAWVYAIFPALSKKRLEARGCTFLADTDNESAYSDLKKYEPIPIWDGSGDLIVINTDLFETDEHRDRVIDELFSTIDLDAAGLCPVTPWVWDKTAAQQIIRAIAQVSL